MPLPSVTHPDAVHDEAEDAQYEIDDAFIVALKRCGMTQDELARRSFESFLDRTLPSEVCQRRFTNFQTARSAKVRIVLTERSKVLNPKVGVVRHSPMPPAATMIPHPSAVHGRSANQRRGRGPSGVPAEYLFRVVDQQRADFFGDESTP